ncbi:alpha/beta hydrolase [Agrococcus beijingensis]|uniref:alpha/beta hydrolase n=1 Tax=Agrococcus beijingensis TaxID=3068634 RepID=UPI0027404679|nr:alpha/beta fold hydrolase [Agrococcus sp. REN33]
MLEIDADAVLWRPGTPDQGGSDDLLVVMHGIGSHEGDLFGLAPHLPPAMTVASLRGPIPFGGGFAWFDFMPGDSDDHTQIDESAAAILAWLDGLEHDFDRVHLLGFSQGGAMAVQLARIAPERFASVVHIASFAYNGELAGDATLAARQPRLPMLTTIGDLDEVINPDKIERSAPWLDEHFAVDRRTYHRAHSIVAEELADIVAFLERV